MTYLKDTTVLVLGLGESGLAMARWCARFGACVRVWDSREQPANAAALAEHVPTAQWVRGPLTDAAFVGVKLVLKSPGLSPQDERIAAALNRVRDTGVLVQGELDLFGHALRDLKAERGYAPKVIAITGTNGKTTTTAMAAQLIARAGMRVAVAGNIGPTMLQTLSDALDKEPAPQGVPDEPVPTDADAAPEEIADLQALDGATADDIAAAREETPEDELALEADAIAVGETPCTARRRCCRAADRAGATPRRPHRCSSTCPKSGCSNSRASSSTTCAASSPAPLRCSTSRRTTSTGTARCRTTSPRRHACSASTR